MFWAPSRLAIDIVSLLEGCVCVCVSPDSDTDRGIEIRPECQENPGKARAFETRGMACLAIGEDLHLDQQISKRSQTCIPVMTPGGAMRAKVGKWRERREIVIEYHVSTRHFVTRRAELRVSSPTVRPFTLLPHHGRKVLDGVEPRKTSQPRSPPRKK
ncbi:hypothetical protein LZ31DRAFT_282511 [Colletotrichum somersetense]|nr:hypothetical protein LZ31DRAFT_282511 [Colletotrichum somersetense]